MREQIEERKANTARGRAKREALVSAMELKDYEFNAHGVELGQFYQSSAVQGDGSQRPAPQRDPELYSQAAPVARGLGGEPGAAAAAKVRDDLAIPLKTVIIGPGRQVTDIYYDWARRR